MADEITTDNQTGLDDLIAFNGIDATTGDYLINPMTDGDASRIAISHPQDKTWPTRSTPRNGRPKSNTWAPPSTLISKTSHRLDGR